MMGPPPGGAAAAGGLGPPPGNGLPGGLGPPPGGGPPPSGGLGPPPGTGPPPGPPPSGGPPMTPPTAGLPAGPPPGLPGGPPPQTGPPPGAAPQTGPPPPASAGPPPAQSQAEAERLARLGEMQAGGVASGTAPPQRQAQPALKMPDSYKMVPSRAERAAAAKTAPPSGPPIGAPAGLPPMGGPPMGGPPTGGPPTGTPPMGGPPTGPPGAPASLAQLPTKAAKQDVRKKVKGYAFHDSNGLSAPQDASAAMASPAAPTLYAAPGAPAPAPAPAGAPVAAPPGSAAPPPAGSTLPPRTGMAPFQSGAAPAAAPAPRSSAPDFGQNSASAAGTNRIDPMKIPRPSSGFPAALQKYKTDVAHPDYSTTVPHACGDYRVQDVGSANPRFIRLTMGTLPSNKEARNRAAIPVAAIFQPMASLRPDEDVVPLVDLGEHGPVRCTRCHGYMNPFCRFVENGSQWLCNLCNHSNETREDYFNHLDMRGIRVDKLERPELCKGTVEYVATPTYIARPPQHPAFLFVVDVSQKARKGGLLRQFIQTMQQVVDVVPPETRLGVITYDAQVHFHVLTKEDQQLHRMLVVSDLSDPFCPWPSEDLVPPVGERRDAWDLLFELLPTLFPEPALGQPVPTAPHAFGPAVHSAYQALKPMGGKVLAFSYGRSTAGIGLLMPRDDPKSLGTAEEPKLRRPGAKSYRDLGEACAEHHISVDYVVMSSDTVDLFTAAEVPRLTCGRVYNWPGFRPSWDGATLHALVMRMVTRETAWEGIGRVRCSEGLSTKRHFGNIGQLRHGTDVRLPVLDSDTAFAVEFDYDGQLDARAYVQSAVLYTTSYGQRRIRVSTTAVGVSTVASTLFRSADCEALLGFACRQACTDLIQQRVSVIRDRLTMTCVDILAAYRKHCTSNPASGQLILPETLKHMPIYTLSMLRGDAFTNEHVSADRRAAARIEINCMPASMSGIHWYPRLYGLHELVGRTECGKPDADGLCTMPPMLRLSMDTIEPTGMYLVEDGMQVVMWIGTQVSPKFISALFGVGTLDELNHPTGELTLPVLESDINIRCRAIVDSICSHPYRYRLARPRIFRAKDAGERAFYDMLVEDAKRQQASYVDFLCNIHRHIQKMNQR